MGPDPNGIPNEAVTSYLVFGGEIAQAGDVIPVPVVDTDSDGIPDESIVPVGQGAGSGTGTYQGRIGGGGGAETVNFKSTLTIPAGQITIVKSASVQDGTDFTFSTTGPDPDLPASFILDDDAGADSTYQESIVFAGLDAGTYTFTEVDLGGWDLASIVATENGLQDTTAGDIWSVDLANRTLTVTIADGEVWTAIFTNNLAPPPNFNLSIDKVTYSGAYDPLTAGDGVVILDGAPVTWRYAVSVSGLQAGDVIDASVAANLIVTDNQGVTPVGVDQDGDGYILGDDLDDTNAAILANNLLENDETWIFEASGTADQASYANTGSVSATATNPGGSTTLTENDVSGYTTIDPSITVDKSWTLLTDADGSGDVSAGDTIRYDYVVSNDGDAPLRDVTAIDDKLGSVTLSGLTDEDSDTLADDLAAGASATGSLSYVIQPGDLGTDIVNVATAGGTGFDDFGNTESVSDSDTETVPVPQSVLSVAKSSALLIDLDGSGDVSAGDTIRYFYTVTNTGTANFTGVTLDDDQLGPLALSDTAGDGTGFLAAGDSESASADYVVLASDLGTDIVNVATADSDQTGPATDTETVPVPTPALTIEKQIFDGSTWLDADTATGPLLLKDADGNVDYRLVLSNTGTANLTDVTVSDATLGITNVLATSFLAAGASLTLDAADIPELQTAWQTGQQVNTASASSVQADAADDPAYYFGLDPSISIDKVTYRDGDPAGAGDAIGVLEGDAVRWLYTVTNDGNVDLSDIVVDDDIIGAVTNITDKGDGDNVLAVGETWIFEAGPQAVIPITSGNYAKYENTGTATGTFDPGGRDIDVQDSDDSSYFVIEPGYVTNSSLCDFGDIFRLIFTPNFGLGQDIFKLSDSNPGQFYYNLAFDAAAQGGSVTLDIPYPFVTQGATPVHWYSGVTINEENGAICFDPAGEIGNAQLTHTLGDFTDTNGDGQIGFGDHHQVMT